MWERNGSTTNLHIHRSPWEVAGSRRLRGNSDPSAVEDSILDLAMGISSCALMKERREGSSP